ncbi:MFS transporter (plasmid) [Rhizobium lusitanum]|uniref:MFS transporter n=1 Tax=Rhizobium lusitanum TaxID=293958 RepID=UPI0016148BC0|nr:MFS transporter [Rhizobium lusitanum]QND44281.1 MFS transporter [Rhizobium lusitanum]
MTTGTEKPGLQIKLARTERLQFIAFSAAFLLSMFFRSYYGVLGPQIAADLRLSPQAYGVAAAAFFISFGILQVPVGLAFDRFGVREVMTALSAAAAVGILIIATCTSPAQLFVGQAVLGAGCAPIFMGIVYHYGSVYDGKKSAARIATVSAVGSLGALISASPLLWVAQCAGWRGASVGAAAATAVITLALWRTVPHRIGVSVKPHAGDEDGFPKLLYLLPILLTISLGGTFRNAWAAPYLSDVFKLDAGSMGLWLTVISFVGIGSSFGLPLLIKRVNNRLIVIVSIALGSLASFGMAVFPAASVIGAVSLMALLYSLGNLHPLLMSEAQRVISPGRQGLYLGMLNMVVFLGVAASSSIFGWIAGALEAPESYRLILIISGAAMAIGVLIYMGKRTWRERESGAVSAQKNIDS